MVSLSDEKEPQKKVQRTSDRSDDEEIHENEVEANSGPFTLGDGSRKKATVTEFRGKVSSSI